MALQGVPVTPYVYGNIMETPTFTPFAVPQSNNQTPNPGTPVLNLASKISDGAIDSPVTPINDNNLNITSKKSAKSLANEEEKAKITKGKSPPPGHANSAEVLNKRNKAISYSIPTEKSEGSKVGK